MARADLESRRLDLKPAATGPGAESVARHGPHGHGHRGVTGGRPLACRRAAGQSRDVTVTGGRLLALRGSTGRHRR